jgi:NAD(P)-dependent dehydrogenase (short-subunit alcohol dehydrogenase family)
MCSSPQKPVAAIVGVGPGLGTALARRFAVEYTVAIVARNADYLAKVASEITASGGRAHPVPANTADESAIAAAFETIRRELGDPEVLIYNAAMRPFGRLMETKPSTFENTWRVNAFGAFLCSQQVVPAMQRRGAARSSSPARPRASVRSRPRPRSVRRSSRYAGWRK